MEPCNEGETGERKKWSKLKIRASGPIISWQTKAEDIKAVTDFTFLVSMITVDGDSSHKI